MSTAALNIAVTVDSRTGVASLRQLGTQAQASGTQMETGFRQGGRSLTDFNGTLKTSVTALTGLFATIAGAAGIGSIIVSTAKMGAAFEYEMATVRGVMQASEEDFKDLSAAARLMGETTEWSAQQSAEALKYMGMTGWDAKTSIAALPGVLDLASAGGLELGRASEIATDSMTALQLGVEDLTRFTDVLTATTTNSSTSVSVMGETFKESAGTATVMGYSLEELSAMAGILASSAIKGSQAGNNLKNMMLDNAKAAAILGTENNDLIGTLKAAKAAQWDMVQISKIYGKENVAAVAALMENIDGYEELEGKLHNVAGATKSLAAIKLDTLTGDVKSLASEASELGLTMFDGFSDELRTSVSSLTGLLRDNKEVFVFLGEAAGKALQLMNDGFESVGIAAKEFAAIINGDMGVMQAFTISNDDFLKWLDRDTQQIEATDKQLSALRTQLANAKSAWNAFDADTGERAAGNADLVKSLESQIGVLETLKSAQEASASATKTTGDETVAVSGKVVEASHRVATSVAEETVARSASSDAAVKSLETVRKAAEDAAEAEEKAAEERKALSADVEDYIQQQTLSTSDYKSKKLDEEYAANVAAANGDKDLQADLVEWYKLKQDEISAEKVAAAERAGEKQKDIALDTEDYIRKQTLTSAEYAKHNLEEEYSARVEAAEGNKKLQTELVEWHKLQQEEIIANTDSTLNRVKDIWISTDKEIKEAFSETLVGGFKGDMDSIEEAWGYLWDSMLKKLADTVVEMAATWTVSGIGAAFEGWDIYHSGLWNLKEDEMPSILQQGEMVIPRDVASTIRDNLGQSKSGDFEGLADATKQWGQVSNWGDNFGQSLSTNAYKALKPTVVNAVMGSDWKTTLASTLSPENAFGLFQASAVDASLEAAGVTSGGWTKAGQILGGVLSTMALGGTSLGLSGVASFAGGYLGDAIGDAFDARDQESLRDKMEDAGLSVAAQKVGLEAGRNFVDHIDMHVDSVETTPDVEARLRIRAEDLAYDEAVSRQAVIDAADLARRQAAYNELNPADYGFAGKLDASGGYSVASGTYGTSFGGTIGADGTYSTGTGAYGTGFLESDTHGGNGSSSSSRGDSTSSPGGMGDNDTGSGGTSSSGNTGHGAGGHGMFANGGIADTLFVPDGEDGFGFLRLGEGVIDKDTMSVLSDDIRSGKYGGESAAVVAELSALRKDLNKMLYNVAKNTKKTTTLLTRFDAIGMEVRA